MHKIFHASRIVYSTHTKTVLIMLYTHTIHTHIYTTRTYIRIYTHTRTHTHTHTHVYMQGCVCMSSIIDSSTTLTCEYKFSMVGYKFLNHQSTLRPENVVRLGILLTRLPMWPFPSVYLSLFIKIILVLVFHRYGK